MITSFFNKSNPIQGILLSGLLIGLVLHQFWEVWNFIYFVHMGMVLTILFQHHRIAGVFPFAHQNTYLEAFATLFMICHPEVIASTTTIAAYLFVLFAFRQFLTIPFVENPLRNIFNSGLSLGIAVMIFAPSFWGVPLFLAALFLFEIRSLRTWISAVIALLTPLILFNAIAFLLNQPFLFSDPRFWNQIAFAFDTISWDQIVLFVMVFLAAIRYFFFGMTQNNTEKNTRVILILTCVIFGLSDVFYSDQQNNPLLFFAFPFSVVMTFTLTTLPKNWQKNLFFFGAWAIAFLQWFFS